MNAPNIDALAETRIVKCAPREIVDAEVARILEDAVRTSIWHIENEWDCIYTLEQVERVLNEALQKIRK